MSLADVVLVDGNNLAHRVWHAAGGLAYPASVNFTGLIRTAVDLHHPIFACVAFDSPNCFRRALLPSYKAGRAEKEEAMTEWLDGLRGLDRIAGVRVNVAPQHEADDVLATIAYEATQHLHAGRRLRTVLCTNDHDAWGLVGEHTSVALLSTGHGASYVTRDVVLQRLGVTPNLVVSYKALVGDSSDNVKGVPQIGPVRARALLEPCIGRLAGRAALNDALTRLDRYRLPCTIEEARVSAVDSYEVLRPRFRAPVRYGLDDLWVVRDADR